MALVLVLGLLGEVASETCELSFERSEEYQQPDRHHEAPQHVVSGGGKAAVIFGYISKD